MSQEYNEHPVGSILNHSIEIPPRIAICIEDYPRNPAAALSDVHTSAQVWYVHGCGRIHRMRSGSARFDTLLHGYESDSRIM